MGVAPRRREAHPCRSSSSRVSRRLPAEASPSCVRAFAGGTRLPVSVSPGQGKPVLRARLCRREPGLPVSLPRERCPVCACGENLSPVSLPTRACPVCTPVPARTRLRVSSLPGEKGSPSGVPALRREPVSRLRVSLPRKACPACTPVRREPSPCLGVSRPREARPACTPRLPAHAQPELHLPRRGHRRADAAEGAQRRLPFARAAKTVRFGDAKLARLNRLNTSIRRSTRPILQAGPTACS